MNHSVATVDETFIITPSTSSSRNKAQCNRNTIHEQKILDNETGSSRSTQQTIEQSFETVSRISTSNAHQLSLSLKISIQEDGDFVLQNTTPNQSCPNDSLLSSLNNYHKDNNLPNSNLALSNNISPNELIGHERLSRSQNDLPDIINNVVQTDTQRYRNSRPTSDVGSSVVNVTEFNGQNDSKSVLVLPDKSSPGSYTNFDYNESLANKHTNCNTKESLINDQGTTNSHSSDKNLSVGTTGEGKIETTSTTTMELLDAGLNDVRHMELNSDQSNSDSGLGFSLNSSGNSSGKSNKKTLSPSCESANSSLISTNDGDQHDAKENTQNDESTNISKNLKSLLKKPGPRARHNRHVTFDQTVIVFCEELDPTFVSNEGRNAFDPPSEYSDNSRPFDPPDDYRDDDAISSDEELDVRDYDDVFGRNNNDMLCCDLDIETEQRLKNIIMGGGNNLGDDQILGMLKDDALLQAISMTVDELGEEDFPIHFNSHLSSSLDEQISDGEIEANVLNHSIKDSATTSKETILACQRVDHAENINKVQSKKENSVATSVSLANNKTPIEQNLNKTQFEQNLNKTQLEQNLNKTEIEQNLIKAHSTDVTNTSNRTTDKIHEQDPCKNKISTNERNIENTQHLSHSDESKDRESFNDDKEQKFSSYQQVPGVDSKAKYDSDLNRPKGEKDFIADRKSVTIRQAVVEPALVSKAVVTNNQEHMRIQIDRCKQCEKNDGNLTSSCQKQSCLQSSSSNSSNLCNSATIIRINPQKTSAQPGPSIQGTVDINCSKNLNEVPIVIPPRVTEQKSTCHLCRNMLSDKNIIVNNKVPCNPSTTSESPMYALPAGEQKTVQIMTRQIAPSRLPDLSANNLNQNYVIQPQVPRPCCEAARSYQTIGLPTSLGSEICPPPARQLVYFVDQHGNVVGTGSIPIAKAHYLSSQLNNKVCANQTPNCTSNQPLGHPNQAFQGGPRLPIGTTIYCNDANCSLLKNSAKKLYIPAMDPRTHLGQSTSQLPSTPRPNLYKANMVKDDKVSSTTRSGHTVYYIQHPLDKPPIKNYGQPSNPNMKSQFPNAHEIRRLDGLNAPPLTHNTSTLLAHKQTALDAGELETFVIQDQRRLDKIRRRYSKSSADEAEDPSFGFSKRPSVKVISKTEASKQAVTKDNHSKERQTSHQLNINPILI